MPRPQMYIRGAGIVTFSFAGDAYVPSASNIFFGSVVRVLGDLYRYAACGIYQVGECLRDAVLDGLDYVLSRVCVRGF